MRGLYSCPRCLSPRAEKAPYNPRVPSRLEKLLGEVAGKDFERLVETRRDLHRHPELAFEEKRTAGIAARRLADPGWEPRERVGKTGVTAERVSAARSESSSAKGRILLPADMDALPPTPATGA